MTHRTLLTAALLAGVPTANADVRLPAVLTSNMVLQADATVVLWGWADPGERVKALADWAPTGASTRADDSGKWRLTLATPAVDPAQPFKPHTIDITGEKNRLTLSNVLLGEVWVCSGQSNMEMPVGDHGGGYRGAANWQTEADNASLPGIRFLTVSNTITPAPADDCRADELIPGIRGWVECTPKSVLNFSATGFFFARDVHAALNVPVGIISADWGGTPAEAWTSADALAPFPEFAEPLAWVRSLNEKPHAPASGEDPLRAWWDKVEQIDAARMNGANWRDPAFDDASWPMMQVPSTWERELADFDGLLWCRRSVTIPESWNGKNLTLSLGPIDDMDATYFDAMPVGATLVNGKWNVPRTYTIPGRAVTPGKHTLAVRILDFAVLGGINGQPEQLFLQPADKSAQPISLVGAWRYAKSAALSELPPMPTPREFGPHAPTSLFNGMIAPLTPMTIRGAIWYQGESNRGRADQYARLFRAMISDWRKQWGTTGSGTPADFPFYFVQIAPFTYGGDRGETAALRDAQRQTLSLPNTGMAVTMDIGNPADIHPNNKQDVGKRLALCALTKTYGRQVESSGPVAREAIIDGDAVRVRFDHAAGLAAKNGPPATFELAGPDNTFHPATATIDGETILLRAPNVTTPTAVRYAWCNDCATNLSNGAGLPAVPFQMKLPR